MAEVNDLAVKPVKVTVQGLELTADPKVFDDIDVIEYMYDMNEGGDEFAVVPFLRKVFGKDWKKVKDGLRDENGRVPSDRMIAFISEFMEAVVPKQSPSSES